MEDESPTGHPGTTVPVGGASGIVRYVADAVVPCDGPVTVLRPGAVEVRGDTVVRVGTPRGPAVR